jgi:DNA-binding transcriptional MerR regulator
MKIGQVATAAEVSVDTVRFYERRGVLPEPRRRPSGYREYSSSSVERIRMAKLLQQLGFTLEEIIDCLHAHDAGNATCEGEMWRLDAVLGRIDARIAEAAAHPAARHQHHGRVPLGAMPVRVGALTRCQY